MTSTDTTMPAALQTEGIEPDMTIAPPTDATPADEADLAVTESADEAVMVGEDFYADAPAAPASRWRTRLAVAALMVVSAVAGAGVSASVLGAQSDSLLKDYGKLNGQYERLAKDYGALSADLEGIQTKLAELVEHATASKKEAANPEG